MLKFSVILASYILLLLTSAEANGASKTCACHPQPHLKLPQHIIAYGSLIERKSKEQTDSSSGENAPVIVNGYQRGWFAKGVSSGLSTTYLGVIKAPNAHFNGTLFRLANPSSLKKYDQRERYYCRVRVPISSIYRLDGQKLPCGEFWIYEVKPEFIAKPSKKYPIIESYVDLFLSGCLEIEEKFRLEGFAAECVDTTSDWSNYWVNDRIYPRRPFVFQPNALAIDKLLSCKIPDIFNQVQ